MQKNIKESYDLWAQGYDTDRNRTRDLESVALRNMLDRHDLNRILEIGCGTGKNTAWLAGFATEVLAVDLSEQMLKQAKLKTNASNVTFLQADILEDWTFSEAKYDLVTFSLVLEHIENLGPIFQKAAGILTENGRIYIGELHPFKQYTGTKARFDTAKGLHEVECYLHHLSDFTQAASKAGLHVERLKEYFDAEERRLPRILSILFSTG